MRTKILIGFGVKRSKTSVELSSGVADKEVQRSSAGGLFPVQMNTKYELICNNSKNLLRLMLRESLWVTSHLFKEQKALFTMITEK